MRNDSSDIIVFFQNLFKEELNVDYQNDPQWFIDLGANIGTQSILMKNLFPQSHVIAVEIAPENCQIITKNLSPYPNVHIENHPISSKNELIEISQLGGASDYWAYTATPVNSKKSKHALKTITIVDLIKKYKLKKIDIVKIDIEPDEVQFDLLSHNNSWLAITDNVFIDLGESKQIQVLKGDLFEPIKQIVEDFQFKYSIKGEFLRLYK